MGLKGRRGIRQLAARAVYLRVASDEALRVQIGDVQSRQLEQLGNDQIDRAEFRVFSQFGEDGILQFLIQRVPIDNHTFVEFGVEDYRESNTRFLLMRGGWRGLIIDSSLAHRRFLEASGLAWRTTVDALHAFVDRDNINDLIRSGGLEGDIGLLSVDVDGNDLWILQAIASVSPRIIVVEYNALFGPSRVVSVPYDAGFRRSERHWSHLYWGASLAALTQIAQQLGYALVTGNRAGNNAFFVRRDVLGEIPERAAQECWRPAQYRESRSRSGRLSYLSDSVEKLRLIRDLPLVDLATDETQTIAALYDV